MSVVIAEDGFPHRYSNGKHAYRCEQCGVVSPWGEAWMWFGAIRDLDEDPNGVMTFCCKDHAEEFERIQPARFEEKPRRRR
jgi:hypothetical protein